MREFSRIICYKTLHPKCKIFPGESAFRWLLEVFSILVVHGGLFMVDFTVVFSNVGGRRPTASPRRFFPNFDHGVGGCMNSCSVVSGTRLQCSFPLL